MSRIGHVSEPATLGIGAGIRAPTDPTEMSLPRAIVRLRSTETDLCAEFGRVAGGHAADPDLRETCIVLATQAEGRATALEPWTERYPVMGAGKEAPEIWRSVGAGRNGDHDGVDGLALLRDLRHLYLMAQDCSIGWLIVGQAAQAAADRQLLDLVAAGRAGVATAVTWLEARIAEASPRALVRR